MNFFKSFMKKRLCIIHIVNNEETKFKLSYFSPKLILCHIHYIYCKFFFLYLSLVFSRTYIFSFKLI